MWAAEPGKTDKTVDQHNLIAPKPFQMSNWGTPFSAIHYEDSALDCLDLLAPSHTRDIQNIFCPGTADQMHDHSKCIMEDQIKIHMKAKNAKTMIGEMIGFTTGSSRYSRIYVMEFLATLISSPNFPYATHKRCLCRIAFRFLFPRHLNNIGASFEITRFWFQFENPMEKDPGWLPSPDGFYNFKRGSLYAYSRTPKRFPSTCLSHQLVCESYLRFIPWCLLKKTDLFTRHFSAEEPNYYASIPSAGRKWMLCFYEIFRGLLRHRIYAFELIKQIWWWAIEIDDQSLWHRVKADGGVDVEKTIRILYPNLELAFDIMIRMVSRGFHFLQIYELFLRHTPKFLKRIF